MFKLNDSIEDIVTRHLINAVKADVQNKVNELFREQLKSIVEDAAKQIVAWKTERNLYSGDIHVQVITKETK